MFLAVDIHRIFALTRHRNSDMLIWMNRSRRGIGVGVMMATRGYQSPQLDPLPPQRCQPLLVRLDFPGRGEENLRKRQVSVRSACTRDRGPRKTHFLRNEPNGFIAHLRMKVGELQGVRELEVEKNGWVRPSPDWLRSRPLTKACGPRCVRLGAALRASARVRSVGWIGPGPVPDHWYIGETGVSCRQTTDGLRRA